MAAQAHPIRQPPIEDLRNALQIAEMGSAGSFGLAPEYENAIAAFSDVARLLRHAISQLGEPSLETVQAASTLVRESDGFREDPRWIRDLCQGILDAQIKGTIPPTWSGAAR